MNLVAEISTLIQKKDFDGIESVWMSEIEKDPRRVDQFLEAAKLLRKADERQRADALLELLADAQKQDGAWGERLKTLKEIGRLSRKPGSLRAAIEEAITKAYSQRRGYEKVMKFAKFNEPESNPVEKADKIENWLTFDEGEVFFMAGRGVGVVTELNPELGVCRLDFEKEKRVSVPLGAAQKFLIPVGEAHVLRRKVTDPDAMKAEALKSPAQMFERLLQSFGKPMTAGEVKDALIGIVPEEKWSSWWTAARKNPQVVVTGSGAKASYSWTASADAAESAIRAKFEKAKLTEQLDLARKHSSRSQELADYFSATLVKRATELAKSEPATAWEVFATVEKLPGRFEKPFDPDTLLLSPVAARVVAAISDRALREQAVKVVADRHGDAPKALGELFFLEEEPRVINLIESLLAEKGALTVRDRLIDETLRYPRRHPKAFYWYCRKLADGAEVPEKHAFNILQQMLEAISSPEFASHKSKFKEFFDRGGLAIRILQNSVTEEQARKFVDAVERYGVLEEYRRELLKGAALMKFPTLREPQVEPIYATAESLAEKRAEFEKLKSVEIPANLKAIQEAREMGDLRENFEYKAARQRQEYLTARISELNGELQRVRVLNPEEVDTSEVRVGTKVALANGDMRREVTILGPWESNPEHGVYSNQSEIAKAMLGKAQGDIVSFMGNDYEIVSISKWR